MPRLSQISLIAAKELFFLDRVPRRSVSFDGFRVLDRSQIHSTQERPHEHDFPGRREGERYREGLRALAEELGVSSQLIFNNRFVSAEELVEHVGGADIYITPYRQEAQIVSGTLAIALGAGKAIVSTPYWHARELLAEKRGVIVPFDRPDAIAQAVIALLENDAERHAMRKRAYLYSRGTTWPKTARAYMASFQRARFERSLRPRAAQPDES